MKFHAFRRGFATELSQNGTSIEIVGKALGHKSLDVTTRYINNNNTLVFKIAFKKFYYVIYSEFIECRRIICH